MNRAERRKHRHKGDDDWVGVQLGWCATDDDLPECRQQTHDNLIRMMGGGRTGGVQWRQLQGGAALDFMESLKAGEDTQPALLVYYRQIVEFLQNDGGWLVVATADGIPVRGRG